ncbi:MAG: hypothetical protein ACR2NL_02555 [Acidimicrobiia bacterium]
MRKAWIALLGGLVASLAISGCDGGEPTLTEYVDEVNVLVADARSQYEELVGNDNGAILFAEDEQLSDYTPADLARLLVLVGDLGAEVLDTAQALDPPELIADLHNMWFEVEDDSFTRAQAALAARAGTAADWYELSDTPEMAAYRDAVARDKAACVEFQATLDATEERGAFADAPWVPAELKEVVNVLLGCDGYPEDPQNMFRPPEQSAP